jgi:hypothetical protein
VLQQRLTEREALAGGGIGRGGTRSQARDVAR